MAEEEREELEEERPKRALPKIPIKLLFIVAGIVGGLVLIIIVASMVARSVRVSPVEFGPGAREEKEAPPILATWSAGMEFIARLADEEPRLVKTGDFRLAYDPKYKGLAAELDKRQFQIRDIINNVLITKTSRDLSSEEGKEEMEREIINRINALLRSGKIEDIYVQIIVQ
jgi:flagellar basal body-associated protein FliL